MMNMEARQLKRIFNERVYKTNIGVPSNSSSSCLSSDFDTNPVEIKVKELSLSNVPSMLYNKEQNETILASTLHLLRNFIGRFDKIKI